MKNHFKYKQYKADQEGNIYGVYDTIITPTIGTNGYAKFTASYTENSKYLRHTVAAHRFIYECNTGIKIPSNLEINHIDGNKLNNKLSNLELCTSSENQLHAYELGLQVSKKGEDSIHTSLTNEEVRAIIREIISGKGNNELALLFKTTPSVISEIRYKRNWSFLFEEPEFISYVPIEASTSKAGVTNLPHDLRLQIINDLANTTLSNREILEKYNIVYKHLASVRKRAIWKTEWELHDAVKVQRPSSLEE